jgi:hypothetical protein
MACCCSVELVVLAARAQGNEQKRFFFNLARISDLPHCSHGTISVGDGEEGVTSIVARFSVKEKKRD